MSDAAFPLPSPAIGPPPEADVCLVIEGAYPYVRGGVSSWTQDLIATQSHLTFHLLVIVAPGTPLELRYKLPPNVCGLTHVPAAELPSGDHALPGGDLACAELLAPALRLFDLGASTDLRELVERVSALRGRLGRHILLDSRPAWQLFNDVYVRRCDGASYLNVFWAVRTLLAGLFSMLLCELPKARCYHGVSTGYAGLLLARAHFETGRPVLLTEHGVYTNERRLEIMSAPWLAVDDARSIGVGGASNKVKSLWIDTFVAYARACYQSCDHIITLFEGNFSLQIEDGALADRLTVIPNGIDLARFASVVTTKRKEAGGHRPSAIALVGRVVPIKDVKTFIRACELLVRRLPDLVCYVLGPMDEDQTYAEACVELVHQLRLRKNVVFTGMVDLLSYFGKVDVLVLTSISEGQPLVILEGGAAGLPSVATDVGACRELICGMPSEEPSFGMGGRVARIGDPEHIAHSVAELLGDEEERVRCGEAMLQRVRAVYDKVDLHRRYAELYRDLLAPQAAGTSSSRRRR